MFGWFKKILAPVERSASVIIPRIKHVQFVDALRDMGAPSDQMPITQPLVGELLVTYAFDLKHMFEMVNPDSIVDLGITPEELPGIALDNLSERVPNIQIRKNGPLLQIVTGGNHEACTILNGEFWDNLAEQSKGPLIVAVPHRDVVVACSADDADAVEQLRVLVAEATGSGDDHNLTNQLLTTSNGVWQVYELKLTSTQKIQFIRKYTNAGLSASREALENADGNRFEAVKQLISNEDRDRFLWAYRKQSATPDDTELYGFSDQRSDGSALRHHNLRPICHQLDQHGLRWTRTSSLETPQCRTKS